MRNYLEQKFTQAWYRADKKLLLLRPLSALYVFTQKKIAAHKKKNNWRAPVPVIIVGNINLGGSGKTPVVIAIAQALKASGQEPGIISRGYKSRAPYYPYLVDASSPVAEAGDEPLLIAKRSKCPVMIGANRQASIETLLAQHNCSVIICDDGLQHYRLQRDIEICVVDTLRGLGNSRCLPEGPLRESTARLNSVDFILTNSPSQWSAQPVLNSFAMQVHPEKIRSLHDDQPAELLQRDIYALAGIAGPERFFSSLRQQGFNIVREYTFPDHHRYKLSDVLFTENIPIIMTEKDAVKCKHLALKNAYYQPISVVLSENFYQSFFAAFNQLIKLYES